MTSSRFRVAVNVNRGIAEQAEAGHRQRRRPARTRTGVCAPERAPVLIEGLIDRAHMDWPEAAFILTLPSAEELFVPRHTAGPPCSADHAGYFRDRVLPFISVDACRHGGMRRMNPFAAGPNPPAVPFFEVDLRSGALVMGARPRSPLGHASFGPAGAAPLEDDAYGSELTHFDEIAPG